MNLINEWKIQYSVGFISNFQDFTFRYTMHYLSANHITELCYYLSICIFDTLKQNANETAMILMFSCIFGITYGPKIHNIDQINST